jgi:tape measure domain-containing protein
MSNQNLQYTLSLKDLFTSKMAGAIKQTSKLDKGISRLQTGIAAAVTVGGIASFGRQIIESLKNYEYFSAALRTLLKGDALQAKALENQLIELAAKTPFNLTELQYASKQLLAYGFAAGDVTKNISMLGDVAAALKIPFQDIAYLYGTLKTQGRAYSKDINEFRGRGIPIIKQLAKQFNVADSEMMKFVEDGKVGFKDVEKAFKAMTSEGGQFFNMMDEQSKTVGGQLSYMADNWEQLKVNIGKSQTGIIASTTNMVNSIIGSISGYFAHMNTEAENFSKHGAISFSWWEKTLAVFNEIVTGGNMGSRVKEQADFQNSLAKSYASINNLTTGYNQLYSLNRLIIGQKIALNEGSIDIGEYTRKVATIKGQIETVKGNMALFGAKEGTSTEGATGGVDANGNASGKGLGSGTEVSGARPQSLTINIEKLVEKLEISTQNIQGGYAQIKEQVTKVLLESVNDLNMITR